MALRSAFGSMPLTAAVKGRTRDQFCFDFWRYANGSGFAWIGYAGLGS